MDIELEKYKKRWLDPNYVSCDTFEDIKCALCRLINQEQYKTAFQLFDAIVNTGIFHVSDYWKVSHQIA